MEIIQFLIDFILHADQHLSDLFNNYGLWIYGILFLIIFCETGLIVTPFLPGDSLLFAAGALTFGTSLNVHLLVMLLILAAVLGDTTNYWIGRLAGAKLFANPQSKIFRRDYLEKTQGYFLRFGGRTLVMARFMPIVRTFAPFVAGMGKMPFQRFFAFSVGGGTLWVCVFIYAGHLFGQVPVVRNNFTALIMGIVVLSFMPAIIQLVRSGLAAKRTT